MAELMGEAQNFVKENEEYCVISCTCGEVYFVVTNKGVVCTECNSITDFNELYSWDIAETAH